ncbi:MAG: tetratricopeptide repeat protein [Planctomycetes bacterium]|nr:tetratricopeptide repeat protein [Planctomycetota bacterium]MBL7041187.1 tetratricopeptide repeat protein [Pirellulaceae bacterium]
MYVSSSFRIFVAAFLLLLISKPAAAQNADETYRVALGHYANGRWDVAEGQLESFLQVYPTDERAGTAMFMHAESLVQQGKYAAAKKGFLRLLEFDPHHCYSRQAIFRTGETSYLSGDSDEARRELGWFREHYPNDVLNAYTLNYLGEISLARGEGPLARSLYEESIRRFPKSAVAEQCRFGLGRVCELQGDAEQARREYRFLADVGGSLADDAQVQIGITYYTRGEYDKAEAAFTTAAKQFPESELLTHARYWLGMSHVARSQWTEAAQTFEDAINSQPDNPLAAAMQYWLAEAYRYNEQLEIAKTYYERVSGDWPDSQWADDSLLALTQMALDGADHEQVDSLARQFDERHAESSLRPQMKYAEGRSLLERQEFAKAVEILKSVAQPQDGETPDSTSEGLAPIVAPVTVEVEQSNWYYLALAYLGNEQHEQALESLAQVRPGEDETDLVDGVRFAQAMASIGLGSHADAITPLRQYLASQPDGPISSKCRIQLAVALAHSDQLDEAVRIHDGLAAGDREHESYTLATYYLAETAYAAGEYGSAERLFTALTRKNESDEYAAKGWSGVGWSNFNLDRSEAAAEAFGRLVDGYPQSELAPEAAMMQAKCLEKLDQVDKAVEAYITVATTFESSDYTPSALFEAARLQEQLDRKGEAASLLSRLVEDHPAFPKLDAALYQLAWLLVDQEKNEQADKMFERLCDEYPQSRYWADATYRLAERAASADRLDRAGELAQRLMVAEHSDSNITCHALYLKGQLAASEERWDDVDELMQRLEKEYPNSQLRLPADYWTAESLFQQKKYDEARERFARLQEKVGDRSDKWIAMIPLRRAQILAQEEQWQDAYDLAIGIQARFPGFHQQYQADYVIGRCLAAQAKFEEARERYERAIRSPEGGATETAAMAQWMIGESYMHQKRYDKAIDAYQSVKSLFDYPRWQAAAMLQAGKCHALKGEHEEAAEVFAGLVERHPETEFAQEASERLERRRASLDEQETANS